MIDTERLRTALDWLAPPPGHNALINEETIGVAVKCMRMVLSVQAADSEVGAAVRGMENEDPLMIGMLSPTEREELAQAALLAAKLHREGRES